MYLSRRYFSSKSHISLFPFPLSISVVFQLKYCDNTVSFLQNTSWRSPSHSLGSFGSLASSHLHLCERNPSFHLPADSSKVYRADKRASSRALASQFIFSSLSIRVSFLWRKFSEFIPFLTICSKKEKKRKKNPTLIWVSITINL